MTIKARAKILLAGILLVPALGVGASARAAETAALSAAATIVDTDGQTIGTVRFFEGATGVLIRFDLTAAPPGAHGTHLHAVGLCDLADGFKSAGGHIAETGEEHGLLTAAPHDGDLPSIYVDDDGRGLAEMFNTRVTLGDAEGRSRLLDGDGSAVVVHAEHDDQHSQPGGGTGSRIACGVIEASN